MHFNVRSTTVDDLKECATLLREELYGPIRGNIMEAWRYFLLRGALISAVVEDRRRRQGSQIVAVGLTYLVTQQFMDALHGSRWPTLAHALVDALEANENPALDRVGVRQANSSVGLNIAFHSIFKQGIEADEHFGLILERLTRRFFEMKSGYNVTQGVTEAIGEEELQLHYAIGGQALDVQLVADAALPPALPCFRIWLHKEVALENPGSQLCRLFLYSPPRFYFSEKEQNLLQQAMQGATDEELASNLGLSLSSVKKRWQSIYERVADEATELLPLLRGGASQNGKRGVEKKQKLLEYVRDHPEELRPHTRPL